MGHGTGGRGSFVPERRGRSLGRHPENGEEVREDLTPYQELPSFQIETRLAFDCEGS